MNAADIMTVNIQTLRPDEPLAAAMDLLAASESRHVPVVNDDGELLGILSDRDLRALLGRYDEDSEKEIEVSLSERAQRPVREIMTRNVLAVKEQTDIEDVVGRLVEERVGALPVV